MTGSPVELQVLNQYSPDSMNRELKSWTEPHSEQVHPLYFTYTFRETSQSMGLELFTLILAAGSAGIIPAVSHDDLEVTASIVRKNREPLATFKAPAKRVGMTGTLFYPFFPGIDSFSHSSWQTSAEFRSALFDYLQPRVVARLQTDLDQYRQQTQADTEESYRQFLSRHGDSTMYGPAMARLAQFAPESNTLAWHHRNVQAIDGYVQAMPEAYRIWFVGEEGLTAWDIREQLKDGVPEDQLTARLYESHRGYQDIRNRAPIYNRLQELGMSKETIEKLFQRNELIPPIMLDEKGRERLVERGLTQNLADALAKPPTLTLENDSERAKRRLKRLVITDNSGKYLSPYTSDGVVAEWVDKAINADMGASVGSAVGSVAGGYAASKALESVPGGGLLGSFIGGAAGSEAGKDAGRATAIEASGGWEYIRSTSDRSFRSLEHMARYLVAEYSGASTFPEVISATDAVYPGLAKAVGRYAN